MFHKRSEKLTDEDRWYLNRYLTMSEELRKAYELKEAYCTWFEKAKEKGLVSVLQTKEDLLLFYELVEAKGLPEFNRAIGTFRNWQTEIVNSFSFNYSNGFLKGINNLTKVLKRNAFGFRNFGRSRWMML